MSPAAGGPGPAPAQSAAAVPQAIAPPPEPGRVAPAASRRDPPGHLEGPDPANAAARKTAWTARPKPAAAAAAPAAGEAPEGGVIIGGDASWPALAESTRAGPKSGSGSSDSLKALSDASGPPPQEDPIAAPSVPPRHPAVGVNPVPTAQNPTSTAPPTAAASSQQNGATIPVRRGGSSGGNSGGGSRGNGSNGARRAANSSGGDGSSGSGGDGNWNDGSLGTGSGCNSSNGDGSSTLDDNDNAPGAGRAGRNGNDSSRNAPGNSHWNHSIRGGSSSNGAGSGDGNNRYNSGGSNHWNNNPRNSSSSSNGGGGRGGYRGRRDHERGANFSPRNFPRVPVMPYQQQQQQQQPGIYQPGPFHRPPPPAAHFIMPQHFYVPPFPYPADMQPYPVYLPPVEQFQNMHLVRPPMQPAWVPPQDQPNLQDDIRNQIEFYFSTNNLCHDTFLRRQMNNQGWVPIGLILGFNRMRAFTGLVDTNYILDAIRGSELLEVQGDNVRRRNDWTEWLLH